MYPIELLDVIEQKTSCRPFTGKDNYYYTCCPVHPDDNEQTLRINQQLTPDGCLIFSCSKGCKKSSILKALHLNFKDVSPNGNEKNLKYDLTIEDLSKFFNENNLQVRYNDLTHDVEIDGVFYYNDLDGIPRSYAPDLLKSDIGIILHNHFKNSDYTRASTSDDAILKLIGHIAKINHYNPMLDMITNTQSDNVDYFEIVYNVLGIDEPFTVGETIQSVEDIRTSQMFVKKWLLQSVALLTNSLSNAFGADGILILQGAQGIGKTSFFKALCSFNPSLFRSGVNLNFLDKDTLIKATSGFINELGEFERNISGNSSEAIKAFITQDVDEVRAPYGRKAEKAPRRTSLCGTCNSSDFLIDQTGNRRFWVVPLGKVVKWELLTPDVVKGLFRQCYDLVTDEYGNVIQDRFRLTGSDRRRLEENNKRFLALLPSEYEILDILDRFKNDRYTWKFQRASDFKENFSILNRYTVIQIGKALAKQELLTKRAKGITYYQLPTNVPSGLSGVGFGLNHIEETDNLDEPIEF